MREDNEIMIDFLKIPKFPYTYGDQNKSQVMFSDRVVEFVGDERVQSHMVAMAFAWINVFYRAQPSYAIPPEHAEIANEAIKTVQDGALGGVPKPAPIGPIDGNVPIPGGLQSEGLRPEGFVLPAMPIEQQLQIAQQQMGKVQPGQGLPTEIPGSAPGGPPGQGPTSTPYFYVPGKPKGITARAVNTVAFTTAMGIVCLNAAWGEPVAIIMCASGLVSIASKVGREVILFMAKHLK